MRTNASPFPPTHKHTHISLSKTKQIYKNKLFINSIHVCIYIGLMGKFYSHIYIKNAVMNAYTHQYIFCQYISFTFFLPSFSFFITILLYFYTCLAIITIRLYFLIVIYKKLKKIKICLYTFIHPKDNNNLATSRSQHNFNRYKPLQALTKDYQTYTNTKIHSHRLSLHKFHM